MKSSILISLNLMFVLAIVQAQTSQMPLQSGRSLVTFHTSSEAVQLWSPKPEADVQVNRPSIVVTDINFGTAPVGLPALISRSFSITNRGNANLTVRSNTGLVPSSAAAVFDISDLKGTAFPMIIEDVNSGFNRRSFSVKFTPTMVGVFTATITFSSNSQGVDSVCRLHGVGIAPGIGVNAIDFGRRRVGDTYQSDAEGGIAQLRVNNTWGNNVSITKVTATGDLSEFEYNSLNEFNGMVLAPAQQVERMFSFKPTKTKHDTVRISFQTSAGTTVVFEAYGSGVIPRLVAEDVDFGTVDLQSATKFSTRQFRLTNLDVSTTPRWEFYDDVSIDDVEVVGGGKDIGSGGQSDVGSQGFSYQKSQLDLPLILPSGLTSLAFNAWYTPKSAGKNSAQLLFKCNAETEPTSRWTGEATDAVNSVGDDQASFSVYPNPVSNYLNIEYLNFQHLSPTQMRVVVSNARGEVVLNHDIGDELSRLSFQSLPAGLYHVQLIAPSHSARACVVKLE